MDELLLGTKYQKFDGDDLKILRIVNKKDDLYAVLDQNNKRSKMTYEELKNCIRLIPDAFLNIMVTSTQECKDIYVCVNKASDYENGDKEPAMVMRQDIYSNSKNVFAQSNIIYVGDNYIKNTSNKEDFKNIFEFDEILDTLTMALYVDDRMDTIFKCIDNKLDGINKSFKEIKSYHKSNEMIKGYCDNLKDFMKENNFMYCYRQIFGITQVSFPINLGNNMSEDGVITLNKKQIKRIEDILGQYITNVHAITYDKDIDISKIVTHSHIMLSDREGKIYLITFVSNGYYEVDEDIVNAMT